MRRFLLLLVAVIVSIQAVAQNDFRAVIKDRVTGENLAGATAIIPGTSNGAISDKNGTIKIENIPDGEQVIIFSFIGYKQIRDTFMFPVPGNRIFSILMESSSEEMDEVIITSTRGTRTIENIPTRVESISGEELGEKGNMKPGDIRMMLNESTGIQTQQTSATSYNSSIRIQGLDGKYTQLLKDGFPLYSGFSGGLSLLQIVPLDLQQVEVIKGASSTLYGGGAIAGLVNLITKKPGDEKELSILLNGTSALGLDASGFYSQKFRKLGTTVFASYNYGNPYDPSETGFTSIPLFNRFTINPRMFLYLGEKTVLFGGFNSTVEDRTGGDILFIKGKGDAYHSYFEKNRTNRFSSQLGFDHSTGSKSKISIKNSIGYYDRTITLPDFIFSGMQISSFSEATFSHTGSFSEWIAGVNFVTDVFSQDQGGEGRNFDYKHTTLGGFIQNTTDITDKIKIESGLRLDYQDDYGYFALPRLSVLLKMNNQLSFRAGGGMGYKIPTVFTEDAERLQFRNIAPPEFSSTKAEKSAGSNIDANLKIPVSDEIFLNINALLFYTRVSNPLLLLPVAAESYEFSQPEGFIDTRGIETNMKFTYNNYKLFIGYTLADVNQHYNGQRTEYPLVAKHRLNNVLMYEIEDKLKIGLEAYYFSPRKLTDNTTGKDYWIFGLMIEKIWDRFSVFANFENITDTRQTRFDTIYTGSISAPVFRDIYAPLDGFVLNCGLKIKL